MSSEEDIITVARDEIDRLREIIAAKKLALTIFKTQRAIERLKDKADQVDAANLIDVSKDVTELPKSITDLLDMGTKETQTQPTTPTVHYCIYDEHGTLIRSTDFDDDARMIVRAHTGWQFISTTGTCPPSIAQPKQPTEQQPTQPPTQPAGQPQEPKPPTGFTSWLEIYGIDPHLILTQGKPITEVEYVKGIIAANPTYPSFEQFVRFTGSNGYVAYGYAPTGTPYKAGEAPTGDPLIGNKGGQGITVIGWNPRYYSYQGVKADLTPYLNAGGS